MNRSRKLILTAHCVLNQNAVVREWERAPGAFNSLVKVMLDENLGILQLPCPEMAFAGEDRPPRTREEYNTPEFRELSRNLARPLVQQVAEYQRQGYQIVGLLGIGDSPSCDTRGEQGVFMEGLMELLKAAGVSLTTFDVPEAYMEGSSEKVVEEFRNYLKDNFKRL
jgi:predicted secreted protein